MKYTELEYNNLAIIIQARLGSTRLPNKMILPFYDNKGIFELIIEKLNKYLPEVKIILATSDKAENDLIENVAKNNGLDVFRGDENDVLKRFINAAEYFGVSKIIRICADNPFLDVVELQNLVKNGIVDDEVDYISFKVNNLPSIKTHFGFWAEYVTIEALRKVKLMTSDSFYFEHVTNFIYENPNDFSIKFLDVNSSFIYIDDVRMTVDTLEDFEMLSEIFTKLSNEYNGVFGINEILKFLDSNSIYKELMKKQILINSK
jgi:spore coat polysaccharide biosynthesis protein SpsF (cytidylyltransferase family)